MNKHCKYFRYVVRHRWFVFIECCKLGVIWRGVIHDASKLLPSEWFPYVNSFYGNAGFDTKFDKAWLLHQHRNPHHWQFWCLTQDEDEPKCLKMPDSYMLEMIADWRGAGRAMGHGDDVIPWYTKNRDKIQLHEETRFYVENLIGFEQLAKLREQVGK